MTGELSKQPPQPPDHALGEQIRTWLERSGVAGELPDRLAVEQARRLLDRDPRTVRFMRSPWRPADKQTDERGGRRSG